MASALKFSRKECIEYILGKLDTDDPLSERYDIGIVVLHDQPRRRRLGAYARSHARHLVRRQRYAYTCPAYEHAPFYMTRDQLLGYPLSEIRIIISRLRICRAVVYDLKALGLQIFLQCVLEAHCRMVIGDPYSHEYTSVYVCNISCQRNPRAKKLSYKETSLIKRKKANPAARLPVIYSTV